MKNFEKYKTAEERVDAFFKHRHSSWTLKEAFAWLDLEAEDEKPLPCPFCGGEVLYFDETKMGMIKLCCPHVGCRYTSAIGYSKEEVISKHNRVARAVKESEAK